MLFDRLSSFVRRHESVYKFIIVGGLATLVHAVVANVLYATTSFPELLDNMLGYCTGFFCSYFGHMNWSFAKTATQEHTVAKSFPKFAVMTLLTFGVNQLVFYVCSSLMSLPFNAALFAGMFVAAVCSYFLNRFWVFR